MTTAISCLRALSQALLFCHCFLESLEREVQKSWELAESDCRDEEDLGYQSIQALREKIKDLEGASPDRREVILLRELEIKPQGNKQKWKKPASCDAQKQILKNLGEDLKDLQDSIRADVMAELLDWVRDFPTVIQEEKARRGVLDFQDLLILARNLLRDNKEIRRYFQERFRYLLVDEFQDTDPLQVEVVFLLSEDGARAENWEEVAFFRESSSWLEIPSNRSTASGGQISRLTKKPGKKLTAKGSSSEYRSELSHGPFHHLLGQPNLHGPDSTHGRTFSADLYLLVAHPDRKEVIKDQPGVILLAPPPGFEPLEVSAPQVREGEAQSIAALIEEMVGEKSAGRWMIFDKKEGGSRPVGFRDMALLFPTLTGIEVYEEALKARSIPYRLEGGKEFYLRQEVRSLLMLSQGSGRPGG